MDLGTRIKEARKAAGLTQGQLAERVGMAQITIRQYEGNRRQPRLAQLEALADALGVPLEAFIGTPTERDKDDLLTLVQELGLPHGPDGDAAAPEVRALIRRVAEVYGEKAALLLKLTSVMSEEGMDQVLAYTKEHFQAYMDAGFGGK